MVKEVTKEKEKEQETVEFGIEPLVSPKYDVYIAAAIVIGAILLVGMVYLNIEAI